jgi:replicative DNA helicase
VDFIQFMDFSEYDHLRLGLLDSLGKLKRYAKNDNVVGIAYSQMSREVEKRRSRNGNLDEDDVYMSDVAESQYIEIIAGYLVFMQWKWLISKNEIDKHTMFMRVAKARFGGFGSFKTYYEPDRCIISPADKESVPF